MGEQLHQPSEAAQGSPSITDLYQGVGRPSSLTPALAERIGGRLLTGNYPTVAARAEGVPERTFQRWMKQGEADDKADIDSVYAHLWRVIDQKDAHGECNLIDAASSGKMGWQGPMTVASRKHRARWEDKESDGNVPRVVVQIGAGAGDVKVGILIQQGETLSPSLDAQTLSSPLTSGLHSLTDDSQGANVNITSLISTTHEDSE